MLLFILGAMFGGCISLVLYACIVVGANADKRSGYNSND